MAGKNVDKLDGPRIKPPMNDTLRYVSAKVILLGAQGVGKTTILSQHIGTFSRNVVRPTIGVDYQETNVHVDEVISTKNLRPVKVNTVVKLKCFDTAGQERFKSIVTSYYRNVAVALLVFDLTRTDTFLELKDWIEELKTRSKDPVVFCIIGNKLDLGAFRKIDRWTAEQFANSVSALYFETSAFRDTGIDEAFTAIAKSVVQRGLGKVDEDMGEGKPIKRCCRSG